MSIVPFLFSCALSFLANLVMQKLFFQAMMLCYFASAHTCIAHYLDQTICYTRISKKLISTILFLFVFLYIDMELEIKFQ